MNAIHSIFLCCLLLVVSSKNDSAECEVCVGFLTKFVGSLEKSDLSDQAKMKDKIMKLCKTARNKDERFCYYVGGLETSATTMLKDILKPVGFQKPIEKICKELQKKNDQICDLKYDKEIDWKTVNIKKMKVKELKKVLEDHGMDCKGCSEKSEFVSKVEEIAKSHGRTEL